MVVGASDGLKVTARNVVIKALKAIVKSLIIYIAYLVIWQFVGPLSQYVAGFQQMIESFVTFYIVLTVLSELTSHTIYQHLLNAAKALFVVGFLLLSLGTGTFGVAVENINIVIDVRLFLFVGMLLGLVSLARSLLQTVNYMSERAEPTEFYPV